MFLLPRVGAMFLLPRGMSPQGGGGIMNMALIMVGYLCCLRRNGPNLTVSFDLWVEGCDIFLFGYREDTRDIVILTPPPPPRRPYPKKNAPRVGIAVPGVLFQTQKNNGQFILLNTLAYR